MPSKRTGCLEAFFVAKTTKPKLPSLKYFTVVYLVLPINGSSRSILAYVCVMWPRQSEPYLSVSNWLGMSSTLDPESATVWCHDYLGELSQRLSGRRHFREDTQGKPGGQVL
jgi:hypothetical protein